MVWWRKRTPTGNLFHNGGCGFVGYMARVKDVTVEGKW